MSYFVQYVYFVTKCFHIIIHFCKHFRTIFNSSSYWGCYSSYGLSHSAQQTWTLLLVRGEFLKPECTLFICTYIFKFFILICDLKLFFFFFFKKKHLEWLFIIYYFWPGYLFRLYSTMFSGTMWSLWIYFVICLNSTTVFISTTENEFLSCQ